VSPAAALLVGSEAPDFTARTQHGEPFRLTSLRGGRPVVVVFYPYAFSRVCTSELEALRDRPDLLGAADFVGVSCDPMFTLSDFWPHGAIASSYGVFDAVRGCALRGTFVIDPAGVVRWSVVNDVPDARDPDDYARALSELVPGLG
jgi:alkyl hydroperoxide reductase subunit AhpC